MSWGLICNQLPWVKRELNLTHAPDYLLPLQSKVSQLKKLRVGSATMDVILFWDSVARAIKLQISGRFQPDVCLDATRTVMDLGGLSIVDNRDKIRV